MIEIKEGYKKTEIGVIPVEWEVVQLDDITTKITSGGTPSRSKDEYFINGTINWLKTGELRDCYIYEAKEKITEEAIKNSSAKLFPIDTLLIAMYGATIGQTAYLKTECATNQACCAIIFDKTLASPFFYWKYFYFLKDTLIGLGRGAGQPNISQGIIKDLKIPLPPLKEQKEIANILSTSDKKIEAIELQIQKAETLKKGLLQKLLSEGIGHSEFKDSELGRIPVGWEVIPFLELADKKVKHSFTGGPFGSDLKSEHYTKQGVRVIQLQNLGDGSFINKDFVYTSEEKAEALKTCQIFPNDIILAKMAEPVARACILPNIEEKYLMGSDGIRLHIDKSKYDTHFILHSINFSRFRDIAIARSTGTTRLRIGLTALKKIPIIIPPLKEQKQIAQILSISDEKLEVLRAKKEKYETLKKGLLQKLLSGEVRVGCCP